VIKLKHHVMGSIVVTICMAPTVMLAVRNVYQGNGAGTYTNVHRLPIQYTSLLITLGVTLIAMLAALIGRALYFWRRRHFERASNDTD